MGLLGAFLLADNLLSDALPSRVLYPFVIASVVNASIWENLQSGARHRARAGIHCLLFLDGVAFSATSGWRYLQ